MHGLVFPVSCGLIGLAALSITITGCGQSRSAQTDDRAGAAVARVQVAPPERRTIRRSTVEPGQIEAYEVTSIYARVSGYVEKWTVDMGDKVKKGQTLAVLFVPELDAEAMQKQAMVEEAQARLAQVKASEEVAQADLDSARAKLAEIKAGIKRADADLARWQSEFRRVEQLFNERAQTGSLLDETRSKVLSAEAVREEVYAHVKTAEAAVRQGVAMLDKARADVTAAAARIKVARFDAERLSAMRGYATISAPYDGVVTRRNVDVGDLTEPGTQHGPPLFIVARDDIVRIAVSVPEMYAVDVAPGDQVLIRLQALADHRFVGKVTRTSWTLDAKNRTLRAEIDVPNPKGRLRPGLYAYATIIVDERSDALTVPAAAIVREGSHTLCVAIVNGRAVRTPVKLGLDDGPHVEVLSGLQGDESVVQAYAATLADGQTVTTTEPAEPAKKAKP